MRAGRRAAVGGALPALGIDQHLGLGLLEVRGRRLAVERGEADRGRLLVEGGLQHRELLVDLGLGGGALVGDRDALGRGLVGRTLLDGLPELVLLALRDDGDVAAAATARTAAARREGDRNGSAGREDPAHARELHASSYEADWRPAPRRSRPADIP